MYPLYSSVCGLLKKKMAAACEAAEERVWQKVPGHKVLPVAGRHVGTRHGTLPLPRLIAPYAFPCCGVECCFGLTALTAA